MKLIIILFSISVFIFPSEASPVEKYISDQFLSLLEDQSVENIIDNPDYGLDIHGFMKKYGYPLESHNLTTEDGYILTVHRIPYGRKNTTLGLNRKPAIILQHGLASSSVDWINKGPKESLGQLLADAGWDVWLSNNRGTQWSRSHVKLNPDTDKEFWDFSFDECGYYDVSALIDYIISSTGNEKVFFLGHSQGTSEIMALASLRPEYNKKIALMALMAPVAHMEHIVSPIIKPAGKYIKISEFMTKLLGITHIDRSVAVADHLKSICSDGSKFQEVCVIVMQLVCGFNPSEVDRTFLPVMLYNMPAGMAMKMMIHYGQEVVSGEFRRYDYGPLVNLEKYKSMEPPHYNISAITAPVALYYSTNDFVVGVKDVDRLASELPNVVIKHLVKDKFWAHVDYIWAKHLYEKINRDVVQHLNSFVKKFSHTTS